MKKQLFAGKFEIQGEISKGQTGTIYYGYDMGLRQEVAIKVYHSHINGRLIRGQAFIEKSKPLLLIDHPNLIKIFKVEEEDDTPVIFMEFFDAPSLQQMIHDKGPLSVQDMLLLAREITEVLVHTHFQGIIHGTLHPGHVLVGPQGQIKVMDLGLSWILMDILSNCEDELLRPLPYFPPEIAKGELLNVSSDLYCLGFMMYEMLTGTVPYSGLPKTSIMGKLAFDQSDPVFDFPESVPGPICDLICDMTRNKSQQRLQDATHVLTIINQQLPKLPLDHDSSFSAQATSQLTTPPSKEPETPKETSSTSSKATKPTTPTPTDAQGKKPSLIPRPKTPVNYGRSKYAEIFRKVGITLTFVVLFGITGLLGYWYRDFLDPNFSNPPTYPENQERVIHSPQKSPIESAAPIVPAVDSLPIQSADSDPQTPIESQAAGLIPQKGLGTESSSDKTLLSTEQTKTFSSTSPNQASQVIKIDTSQTSSSIPKISDSNQGKSLNINPSTQMILPTLEKTLKPSNISSQKKTRQKLLDQGLPKETISQKTEVTSSAVSSDAIPHEPTDEEIEAIIQAVDTPPVDFPVLPESEPAERP